MTVADLRRNAHILVLQELLSRFTDDGSPSRTAALDAAISALAAHQPVREAFQSGVAEWMNQCFLPSLANNMTERGDRLLEEVLELLQAHGYDSARVPTLVNYVFGRPVGEPAQEVGGVMVTLAAYCSVAGLSMQADGQAELDRINQPEVMARIREKQEAKNALHFDTPLPGSAGQPSTAGQDVRAQFEAWHCEKFKTRWQTGAPTRDMHNGVWAHRYGPAEQQARWELWQAASQAALAASQQVGQEPVLWVSPDVLNAMTIHRAQNFPAGGMGLACPAGSATVPLYAAPPAQAVDLPYSLDADPAGIRASVCDVITGTLLVGAQGHTPPPAGHWAEPFWKAARADAAAQAEDLGSGIQAIACERERQLRVEGFSPACDAHYIEGELARAATAYAQLAAMDLQAGTRSHIASREPPFFWPWASECWKPVDARRDLVRAGALIAAQIDLLDSQAVRNG